MLHFYLFACFFALSLTSLWSERVETFYGEIEVEEPILVELIHSLAFERLKHLHQYGVSYYIKTHPALYWTKNKFIARNPLVLNT